MHWTGKENLTEDYCNREERSNSTPGQQGSWGFIANRKGEGVRGQKTTKRNLTRYKGWGILLNRFGRLRVNLGCGRRTTGQGQGLVRKRAACLSDVRSRRESSSVGRSVWAVSSLRGLGRGVKCVRH